MKKNLTKLVQIVLVLSVICSGFGNVLCFGADGHVAVESLVHSHCHDHDEHEQDSDHSEQADWGTFISDSCSPCVDVVMGNEIEPVRPQKTTQYDTITYTLITVDVSVLAGFETHAGKQDRLTFFTPLKSIVLLT